MPVPRALASTVLVSVLAAAAVFACSPAQPAGQIVGEGAPPGEGEGQDTSQTVPKSGTPAGSSKPRSDTCIGKAGFTFDDGKTCDICMSDQDGCCQKLIGCFKDDPQCAALQKCVDDCSGTGGGSGEGGTPTQGTAAGKTIFVNEVYASVNPTCGSCHSNGQGGAPIFFGANADATYTQFLANNFHMSRELIDKVPHLGPDLTAAQKTIVQKWITAEGGPGGGGGTGTGGGGGTGGGTGTGSAEAGLTGKQCKDACKVQYAAALPKWDAYQVCITTTCKTQCQ